MRRLALGFSLLENVFAAMMVATVVLGMSTVISTYTVSQQKTKDRPFAINLAQQQMDEVLVNVVTQNAMVFDTASPPRGRSYYLKAENLSVSRYFFNNFPLDAPVDPVADAKEMAELPWTKDKNQLDTYPVSFNPKNCIYNGCSDYNGGAPYIRQTLFYRNRFYRAGGDLVDTAGNADPWKIIKDELAAGVSNPPKYAVRMQLFGIPSYLASDPSFDISPNIADSTRIKASVYDEADDPRKPPTGLEYLIGDSCISAADTTNGPKRINGATGRMYVRERVGTGSDDRKYYPHFTSKVLVARVYRIEDYTEDGTFFVDGAKPDIEIASSSLVVVGRVQRK